MSSPFACLGRKYGKTVRAPEPAAKYCPGAKNQIDMCSPISNHFPRSGEWQIHLWRPKFHQMDLRKRLRIQRKELPSGSI